MSAAGTAAGSARSPASASELRHQVEAAAMGTREFDYDGLVRPMEARMRHSIWRVVRQKEAAEDALQDALTVIWKKRDTVARHPNPQALILRISIAAAYDAVRRSRRRLRHEISGRPGEPADGSPARDPEDRRLRAEILAAVGRLPRRQALAFLLRVIEELSYEEIARTMACKETTVRVQVKRARAALAKRLTRLCPDPAVRLGRVAKETER